MNFNSIIEQLDWSKQPKGLYEPIGYTLAAGGKRIRPTLCILGYQVFKEDITTAVTHAALAFEIFHNFTLLHDDVMDQAQVRRGRPCVHIKWNANTAILSGDQMMIEAYKQLNQLPDELQPSVLRLFNQMATEICEGQQYDVDFETQKQVSIEHYMLMIRLKTSVLLATALKAGAYIAGASDEAQQALYAYGIALGLAFQIQDDYLDCYGNEQSFGKTIGGDIREGKKTWLWLTAEQCTQGLDTRLYTKDYTQVMAVYAEHNIAARALQEIAQLTNQALDCLNGLPNNSATEQLRHLAENMIHRNS